MAAPARSPARPDAYATVQDLAPAPVRVLPNPYANVQDLAPAPVRVLPNPYASVSELHASGGGIAPAFAPAPVPVPAPEPRRPVYTPLMTYAPSRIAEVNGRLIITRSGVKYLSYNPETDVATGTPSEIPNKTFEFVRCNTVTAWLLNKAYIWRVLNLPTQIFRASISDGKVSAVSIDDPKRAGVWFVESVWEKASEIFIKLVRNTQASIDLVNGVQGVDPASAINDTATYHIDDFWTMHCFACEKMQREQTAEQNVQFIKQVAGLRAEIRTLTEQARTRDDTIRTLTEQLAAAHALIEEMMRANAPR